MFYIVCPYFNFFKWEGKSRPCYSWLKAEVLMLIVHVKISNFPLRGNLLLRDICDDRNMVNIFLNKILKLSCFVEKAVVF